MSAGAGSASEGDTSTGVDSKTVVLVLDNGTADGDVRAVANVKGVSVVAEASRSGVVNGDILDGQTLRAVDRKALDGAVHHFETSDR